MGEEDSLRYIIGGNGVLSDAIVASHSFSLSSSPSQLLSLHISQLLFLHISLSPSPSYISQLLLLHISLSLSPSYLSTPISLVLLSFISLSAPLHHISLSSFSLIFLSSLSTYTYTFVLSVTSGTSKSWSNEIIAPVRAHSIARLRQAP